MRAFAVSMLVSAVVTVLVTAAAPEGKLRGWISFAAGLALLLALTAPLRALDLTAPPSFDGIPLPTDPSGGWSAEVQAQAEQAASEALSRAVERACGLAEGTAAVTCRFALQDGQASVTYLSVCLRGSGVFGDLPAVRAYLEREVGIDCEVILHP